MNNALWFLLGCSLMTNFFLLWKLSDANNTIEEMNEIPLDENTKDDADVD